RSQAELFSERQVALLQTFADQAVIAIENVRLFKELEARNHDLTEALEQQTATSEILRVISSSPTDVQPVFDTIATNAARLCNAVDAVVLLPDGADLVIGAHYGMIPTDAAMTGRAPIGTDWVSGRAFLEARTIHVPDVSAAGADFPRGAEMARRDGDRAMGATTRLRAGVSVGVLFVRRASGCPVSDAQIVLLQTFADQAVIAIENVRLFKELEARNRDLTEALEQQTATAGILRVISSSPTDVQPVFDAVAESAARLCDADVEIFR